jgi:hypothetical protein
MVVTVSGREIVGRDEQDLNALGPIVVRLSPLNTTSVRAAQFSNAFA